MRIGNYNSKYDMSFSIYAINLMLSDMFLFVKCLFRVIRRQCSTGIQKMRQICLSKEGTKKVILKNRRHQHQLSLGAEL
jgi:hypothetical protein